MQPPLTFEEWRIRARPLLAARVAPRAACAAIADAERPSAADPTREPAAMSVPPGLLRMLDDVSCFRADGRYELMYRLAWRTLFENRRLLEDAADPDVRSATLMSAAVRRDVHKMHAFVRFREIAEECGAPGYLAWFEPEHDILRRGARFFVDRFPNMRWTIATPRGAARWDLSSLTILDAPLPRAPAAPDAFEELWRTYYRHICNVARLNAPAMQREMPKKYWRGLPEAAEIAGLMREGRSTPCDATPVEGAHPASKGVQRALASLAASADGPQNCRRCGLWEHATQAVAGSGPRDARIMLVGEQPGDEEDLRGLPFVGPAGRVLDRALAAAGIDRARVYVTNAVKHFTWEPRGKRRLHKKPGVREIEACNLWLQEEIAGVTPRVIVALGATALRSLTGATQSVDAARRQRIAHRGGTPIVATYHPSAILRAEGANAAALEEALIGDLSRARSLAEDSPPPAP